MQNQGNLIPLSEGSSTSTGDNIEFALEPVGNLSPTEFKAFPGEAENRAISSSDQSQQDQAFLEDSNPFPVVPEAIKGIPPAIFRIFGDKIQEFDDYGRRQWLRKVEEPECGSGSFALCCNVGAPEPVRVQTRFPAQRQKTTASEILRRRRKCNKCTCWPKWPLNSRRKYFFSFSFLLFSSIFKGEMH